MAKLRLWCAFALFSGVVFAQREVTVAQLASFIKSSVQMKTPDRQVADTLRTFKLSNKLDDQTIEDLQTLGAGPRTVAALKTLADASAKLAPPPPPEIKAPPKPIPPPDEDTQRRLLADLHQYAASYTAKLPDFICMQMTYQKQDPTGKDNWATTGTIQEQLSYASGHENYKVVMVNNQMSTVAHDKVKGNKSSGEFGSMLAEIFEEQSHAEFTWARWTTWHGHLSYVFSYKIPQEYSQYQILDEESGRMATPGYHGLVYADKETGAVLRVTLECDNLAADFPIQDVSETLDYDFQSISGRQFVLPLKADVHSRRGRTTALNQIQFRGYRKYSADAVITFDTPEPLPDEKEK